MKRPKQEWCEPHLEHIRKLEAYVDYLESMTTKAEKIEECSHDRKTDDINVKPNDILPRRGIRTESANNGNEINLNALKEYIKKHGTFLSDSPTDFNTSDWGEKRYDDYSDEKEIDPEEFEEI